MVAVRGFSGLLSSLCAFASAAASVPIESLDRCMTVLHGENVEADGSGFRALRPDPVTERFLRVFRHQDLELGLGAVMVEESRPGGTKRAGKLGQGIGGAHVDDAHGLDARTRWFDQEEPRGLAG